MLEPRGQALVGGLLHHTRPGEGNEHPRLGQGDVALHREARRDAARGRVRQHHHVEQSRLGVPAHRGGDLGHLHERRGPLLHARPARHGEAHHGDAQLEGPLEEAAELLAHHGAHGTHHELAVHHEDAGGAAADGGHAGEDGVVLARAQAGAAELLLVSREAEEVPHPELGVHLLEAPRVHRHREAAAGPQPHGMAAARAHVQVVGQDVGVRHATAAGALHEHVARRQLDGDLGHGPLEHVHALGLLPIRRHRGAP